MNPMNIVDTFFINLMSIAYRHIHKIDAYDINIFFSGMHEYNRLHLIQPISVVYCIHT